MRQANAKARESRMIKNRQDRVMVKIRVLLPKSFTRLQASEDWLVNARESRRGEGGVSDLLVRIVSS